MDMHEHFKRSIEYVGGDLQRILVLDIPTLMFNPGDTSGPESYQPVIEGIAYMMAGDEPGYADYWRSTLESHIRSQDKPVNAFWMETLLSGASQHDAALAAEGYTHNDAVRICARDTFSQIHALAAYAGRGWPQDGPFSAALTFGCFYASDDSTLASLGRLFAAEAMQGNFSSQWVIESAAGMAHMETGTEAYNAKLRVFTDAYITHLKMYGVADEIIDTKYLPPDRGWCTIVAPVGMFIDPLSKSDSDVTYAVYPQPEYELPDIEPAADGVANWVLPAAAIGTHVSRTVTDALRNEGRWSHPQETFALFHPYSRWRIEEYNPEDEEDGELNVNVLNDGYGIDRALTFYRNRNPDLRYRVCVQHYSGGPWVQFGESFSDDDFPMDGKKGIYRGFVVETKDEWGEVKLGLGVPTVGFLRGYVPRLWGALSLGAAHAASLMTEAVLRQPYVEGQVSVELSLTSDPYERQQILAELSSDRSEGLYNLVSSWHAFYPDQFPWATLPDFVGAALSDPEFSLPSAVWNSDEAVGSFTASLGYTPDSQMGLADIFTIVRTGGIENLMQYGTPAARMLVLLARLSPYQLYHTEAADDPLSLKDWHGLLSIGARPDVVVVKPNHEYPYIHTLVEQFRQTVRSSGKGLFGLRSLASPQLMSPDVLENWKNVCIALVNDDLTIDLHENKLLLGWMGKELQHGYISYDQIYRKFRNDTVHTYMAFAQAVYACIRFTGADHYDQNASLFAAQYERLINPVEGNLQSREEREYLAQTSSFFRNVRMHLDVVPWDLGDTRLSSAMTYVDYELFLDWVNEGNDPASIPMPDKVYPLSISPEQLAEAWVAYRHVLIGRTRT